MEKVPPRFELGLCDSKSQVVTARLWDQGSPTENRTPALRVKTAYPNH